MEYAVIETGGKQYKVNPGLIIEIDYKKGEKNQISFDKVLLHVADGAVSLGKPYLTGMSVTGSILDEKVMGDKIRVARFTAKSRHRRVIGFRPTRTKVQIDKIVKSSASRTSEPKVQKAKAA